MVFFNNLKERIASFQVIYSQKKSFEVQNAYVNFNERLQGNQLDDYEPYDYGSEQNPLGFYGALLHLLKFVIGSGILALPFCFLKVGYVIGLCGVIAICLLYLHIVNMLLTIEYNLCKRFRTPNLTYLAVVQKSFDVGPKYFRKLKSTFSILIYFNYVFNGAMCNASYLLIMGCNLKQVYDFNYRTNIPLINCLNFLIIPLILLCWIPKLKFLIPLSMVTNSFTLINIIIILSCYTKNGVDQQIERINDLSYLPQFFGIVLGAITCTGLLMPVKNDMEKPKKFRPVVNICIITSTVIYTFFAARAYFTYGRYTQGNILLNLPTDRLSSIIAYSLYTITLCVSFTINLYIIFDTIWTNYLADKLKNNKRSFMIACLVKFIINVWAYVMAAVIPNFEMITSLAGSFCIFTEICLPPFLQILISYSNEKFLTTTTWKNISIVLVAFCSFVYAFVQSVSDIVALYYS